MSVVRPAEAGIDEEARLVVHDDRDKRYHLLHVIAAGASADIDDPDVESRPWDFRYKLQVRDGARWVDRTPYRRMPSTGALEDHLLGGAPLDDAALTAAVRRLVRSETAVRSFKKVAYLVTDRLLRGARTDDSLRRFVHALNEAAPDAAPFYADLGCYLGTYVELKDLFTAHRALLHDVRSLPGPRGAGTLADALRAIAHRELDRGRDRPLSTVMAGQLVSLLGDRGHAAALFDQAVAAPVDHLTVTDVGAHTFLAGVPPRPVGPSPLRFLEEPRPRGRTTLVVTADTRYFRMYGATWLAGVAAVKDVDVHVHLVGHEDEVVEVVEHAGRLLDDILAFRGARTAVRRPTWSFEALPAGVGEARTFYACARFLNARRLMEAFDGPVYLADADMAFTAHPSAHLESFRSSRADVGLVLSTAMTAVIPWRRVMAGTVFVRPSEAGMAFVDAAASYVRACLPRASTWTLDQNALYYAYESTPDLSVRPVTDRVLAQWSQLNKHVEQL